MTELKVEKGPVLTGLGPGPGIVRRNWQRWWRLARWLVAATVALLTISYVAAPYVLGPVVTVARVARQDVVQTVVASGQVQTPYRVAISSQITGVVADVPVGEGQTVKSGDLLVQIDDTDAHEQVKLAQGALEQAQARLKQLTGVAVPGAVETLKQAQATLLNDQKAFDRVDKLHAQGFATQAQVDDGRKALDVAKSQVSAAQIQLDTSKPGGMDYLMAKTQLTQAEAGLHSAEARLAYTQITAPRDGTLITRNVEKGYVVQAGKDLMDLAPAGETQIVVQIDEQNLGLLQLGQVAHVVADAYPTQIFEGKVIYINPSVDSSRGSIEVKLFVPNPPATLRQDMTVSVEIEVARHQQAVVVESAAVHDLSGVKPWVMAISNGHAKRTDVVLGAIGDVNVEIVKGIRAGDLIVRGGNSTLTDGQRVRTWINE